MTILTPQFTRVEYRSAQTPNASIRLDCMSAAPEQRLRNAGRLALGTWAFGGAGWGVQRDEDSLAAMAAAWDHGVRHWDTALAYGAGHAEVLCGEFLADRRDRAFLATKGV